MKKYLMCIIAGLGALSCSRKAADLPVSPIGEETISSLVSTMETPDRALLERGVRPLTLRNVRNCMTGLRGLSN